MEYDTVHKVVNYSFVNFDIYTAVPADESYLAQNLERNYTLDLTHYKEVRAISWQDHFEEGMSNVAGQDAGED